MARTAVTVTTLSGTADLVWTQGEHGGEVTHTARLCGLDIVVQVCAGDPVHGEPEHYPVWWLQPGRDCQFERRDVDRIPMVQREVQSVEDCQQAGYVAAVDFVTRFLTDVECQHSARSGWRAGPSEGRA